MHKFEVERGKRVRVVSPAPSIYIGQDGEVTTYFRSESEWWLEVRLGSGPVVDFRLSELIALG